MTSGFWNAPRVPLRCRKEQVIFRRAESSRTRRTRGILEGGEGAWPAWVQGATWERAQIADLGEGGLTRFSLHTVPQKFSAVPVRSDECCIGCGWCRTGRGTTQRAERTICPNRSTCTGDAAGRAHS